MSRKNIGLITIAAALACAVLLAGCVQTPASSTNSTTSTTTSSIFFAQPFDCGSNYTCFLNEATNCTWSKVNFAAAEENSNIVYNWTSALVMAPAPSGDCALFQNYTQMNAFIDPNVLQADEGNATAIDELNASLQNAISLASTVQGLYGTCTIAASSLYPILVQWGMQNYTTLDNTNAQCSGPLYTIFGGSSGGNQNASSGQ